ncbi:MAG: hypothetical protein ING59_00635 [Burkholderiales bacterium]|nr:hypothetical protein [Burkholderiales bacterium]
MVLMLRKGYREQGAATIETTIINSMSGKRRSLGKSIFFEGAIEKKRGSKAAPIFSIAYC